MCQASPHFVQLRCRFLRSRETWRERLSYLVVLQQRRTPLRKKSILTGKAFANDETSQFLNAALVNNPMLKRPANGAGVTLRWDSGRDLGFSLGGQTSHDFVEDLLSQPFVIGEIDYHATFLIEGNYRLWARVSSLETNHKRQMYGGGISIDQLLTPQFGLFVRAGLNQIEGISRTFFAASGGYGSSVTLGWWQHAAAAQRGQLLGIDLVVCGLAAVHGFHVESMPPHAGEACCGTEVGEPVPGGYPRRPLPSRHERAPQPGETVPARLAWCGGAALRHCGSRCRHTYSGHARRYRNTRGADRCRIALRSPPRSCVAFSQGQHATGVCCGGGRNHHQSSGADALRLTLRFSFRARLTAGVR